MFGVVAGDVSTSTGQNLDLIRWETGLDPLSSSLVELKAALATGVPSVPVMDGWRVDYLGKLLDARGENYYLGEDSQHLTVLIESLCST